MRDAPGHLFGLAALHVHGGDLASGRPLMKRNIEAFERSGAEAIMLARGSLGDPWRFGRLLGLRDLEPTSKEVARELEWVIGCCEDHLGGDRAGRYLRKFYPWYADRLDVPKPLRKALVEAPTTAAARLALDEIVEWQPVDAAA